ncbi:MAG: hypothetical protein R3E39_29660 [Anaerolineae bacterium]
MHHLLSIIYFYWLKSITDRRLPVLQQTLRRQPALPPLQKPIVIIGMSDIDDIDDNSDKFRYVVGDNERPKPPFGTISTPQDAQSAQIASLKLPHFVHFVPNEVLPVIVRNVF